MNFSWRPTWIVLRKELMDGLRDKRSLYAVIVTSLLMPVLMALMLMMIAEQQRSAEEIRIPVAGQEYAPAFVDWLRQQSGVTVVAAPVNPEEAVRKGEQDVVLVIEKEFGAKLARSVPAPVKLVGDVTRNMARPKVERVRALVNEYS
ncbi:MAG: ABC transporter permease, partial [bacterium]